MPDPTLTPPAGGAKQGPLFRSWTHEWWSPRPTNFWRLPAESLPYRLFLNGNQKQPLLRCLPGMGTANEEDAQKHGLGPVQDEGRRGGVAGQPGLCVRAVLRAATARLSAVEPLACLLAVPGLLLVLLPWLRLLRVEGGKGNAGLLQRGGPQAVLWSPVTQRGGGGGGGGGCGPTSGGGGGPSTPASSVGTKGLGEASTIGPLMGMASLACGLCLAWGIRPYLALMRSSLPAAAVLVDALHLLCLGLLAFLVAVDMCSMLKPLQGLPAARAWFKGSKVGRVLVRSCRGCWGAWPGKWTWARAQRRAACTLLVVAVLCVGMQAGVQAVNGLATLALPPQRARGVPGLASLGLASQSSSSVLCALLYMRSLFSRWQAEARATLLVGPCLFFAARHWQ